MNWLTEALEGKHFRENGFDSVHIDELPGMDYVKSTAVEKSFALLDELVLAYRPHARDVMAMLVIVLADEDENEEAKLDLRVRAVDEIKDAWDGFTPPELYVTTRAPRLEPYVVEEYKKPYPIGTYQAPYGQYYAYYRSSCQAGSSFVRGVYVEHYPSSSDS